MTKWVNRMMGIAKTISTFSKDPSTKVGAVIVDDDWRIVSTGFNGPPQRVNDKFLENGDRNQKIRRTLHAEINAILFSRRDLTRNTIIVTAHPCSQCAAAIIQTGIKKVICLKPESDFLERWKEDIIEAKSMFKEADVICLEIDDEI